MIFVRPKYEILTDIDGPAILKRIERAIRTAYKSEEHIKIGSAEKLIKKIVHELKHLSTIEHESVSVRIWCDRGVSHEIVRHRLASYTQESSRYCNYTANKFNNQVKYIIPSWLDERVKKFLEDGKAKTIKDILDEKPDLPDHRALIYWWTAMHQAEINYENLIQDEGWTAQQARAVLPNSLKTELVMTANLREWRHFFRMRADKAAHPQMREIAEPMLVDFKKQIPVIFEDL